MSSQKQLSKQEIDKEIPELFAKMTNLKSEEDKIICNFANKENVALIAFIAPYGSVRISPIEEARAIISLREEFGIEILAQKITEAGVKKAYLLVNSPGGNMDASYKIARTIQTCVKEIITFIPHIAASGGTLLALTGNPIIMGPMSHITPLDIQIHYKGTTVSANTFMRFFSRSSNWFKKSMPEEEPYTRKALTDKLDPFLMEEWNGLMETSIDYVGEILKTAGLKDSEDIAYKLVMTYPSHGYVINYEKAEKLKLNVKKSSDFNQSWKIMRYWLGKYLFEKEMTHCIRYALPIKELKDKEISKKGEENERK